MRGWIAVALLVSLAFAGCASNDPKEAGDGAEDGEGAATGSSSQSMSGTSSKGTGSSTTSGTAAPGQNRGPVASITLAANQSASGAAPLAVTFVLNGTDPDGDALSWVLSFGDNSTNATGTTLPAQQEHTYASAGNVTARFSVSDGKTTVSANYTLTVTDGASGGDLPAPIVFTGSGTNLVPGFGCTGSFVVNVSYHDFDGDLAGVWKFKVEPAASVTEWWTGDASSETIGSSGVIPAGRDNVAVCPEAVPTATAVDYTLTLYHPDDVI